MYLRCGLDIKPSRYFSQEEENAENLLGLASDALSASAWRKKMLHLVKIYYFYYAPHKYGINFKGQFDAVVRQQRRYGLQDEDGMLCHTQSPPISPIREIMDEIADGTRRNCANTFPIFRFFSAQMVVRFLFIYRAKKGT